MRSSRMTCPGKERGDVENIIILILITTIILIIIIIIIIISDPLSSTWLVERRGRDRSARQGVAPGLKEMVNPV